MGPYQPPTHIGNFFLIGAFIAPLNVMSKTLKGFGNDDGGLCAPYLPTHRMFVFYLETTFTIVIIVDWGLCTPFFYYQRL